MEVLYFQLIKMQILLPVVFLVTGIISFLELSFFSCSNTFLCPLSLILEIFHHSRQALSVHEWDLLIFTLFPVVFLPCSLILLWKPLITVYIFWGAFQFCLSFMKMLLCFILWCSRPWQWSLQSIQFLEESRTDFLFTQDLALKVTSWLQWSQIKFFHLFQLSFLSNDY